MQEIKNQTRADSLRKLPLELLMMIGLFVASLLLFGFLIHEVIIKKEDLFDSKVTHFLSVYSSSEFISIMTFFTFFGSMKFLVPAYALLIAYYFSKRKIMLGIHLALIAITGTVLSFTAKRIFQRARPDLPLVQALKTYSFPSGHTLSSFIFCSILVYLFWNTNIRPIWKWIVSVLLFIFSLTIGISRIVLKAHYPSDVLAGYCLGFVWVILSFYLIKRIQSKRRLVRTIPEIKALKA
jgi:membrane-associated phospholipid phosphatase